MANENIILVDSGGKRQYILMTSEELQKLINSPVELDVEWDVVLATETVTADEFIEGWGDFPYTDAEGWGFCSKCDEHFNKTKDGIPYCDCDEGSL